MERSEVRKWTMDQLLEQCPEAVEVFVRHGVDPRTRCNHAVRHYLELGQVLGRTCPVDDVNGTILELEKALGRSRAG